MSNDYSSPVSKVWNFTHVLRDQGLGCAATLAV